MNFQQFEKYAEELIRLKMLERNALGPEHPLTIKDLRYYRYTYFTLIAVLCWFGVELGNFLTHKWIEYIRPLAQEHFFFFLLLVILGIFKIAIGLSFILAKLVSPITESFEKLWEGMDKKANQIISDLPFCIRVPLIFYYTFTFDENTLWKVKRKYEDFIRGGELC